MAIIKRMQLQEKNTVCVVRYGLGPEQKAQCSKQTITVWGVGVGGGCVSERECNYVPDRLFQTCMDWHSLSKQS